MKTKKKMMPSAIISKNFTTIWILVLFGQILSQGKNFFFRLHIFIYMIIGCFTKTQKKTKKTYNNKISTIYGLL